MELGLKQSKDVRPMDGFTNHAISKMSGNGMHLASAGFRALMAMICTTDKQVHID